MIAESARPIRPSTSSALQSFVVSTFATNPEAIAGFDGTAAFTGRPSATHFCQPPSRIATFVSPIHRAIHHSRAAYIPPASSYATIVVVSVTP